MDKATLVAGMAKLAAAGQQGQIHSGSVDQMIGLLKAGVQLGQARTARKSEQQNPERYSYLAFNGEPGVSIERYQVSGDQISRLQPLALKLEDVSPKHLFRLARLAEDRIRKFKKEKTR